MRFLLNAGKVSTVTAALLVNCIDAQPAWAECTFDPGGIVREAILPIEPEVWFTLGESYLSIGVAMGYTSTWTCTNDFKYSWGLSEAWRPTANIEAFGYLTNDRGFSIRPRIYEELGGEILGVARWPPDFRLRRPGHFATWRWFTVDLIHTGEYTSGGILHLPNPVAVIKADDLTLTILRFERDSVLLRPRQPTCVVSPESEYIPIDLGRQSLNGIGSQSPPEHIPITLNCLGGLAGNALTVHVGLTDANDPSNTSDVLSLVSDTGTPGAGIRITRDDGSVVRYGPVSPRPGAPHQWRAGEVRRGDDRFVFDLYANFIQTEASVTGGKVSAQATFTIAYE